MARNTRPKPLYGAKKYDRTNLACTNASCRNKLEDPLSEARVFFLSYATTPAKRVCRECWENPPKTASAVTAEILRTYGLT
jgi:hypothetical protein